MKPVQLLEYGYLFWVKCATWVPGELLSPISASFCLVMFDPLVFQGNVAELLRIISFSTMIFGMLSTMIAPVLLSITISWLALTTFAVISILAAFVHMFLPNLGSVPMFTSVEEGERYYSSKKATGNIAKIIVSSKK